MIPRVVEIHDLTSAVKEIHSIGCDKTGTEIMAPKAVCRVIKLKGLRPAAANIIKQEMLSFGGEAATAYGAINNSVRKTDVLIIGTKRQIRQLIEKLKMHQFELPRFSIEINNALNNYESTHKPIKIGRKTFDFGLRTYVIGILNVTPDSFSDGGKFLNVDDAVAHAKKLMDDGADIIDIGGESTRPGASSVSPEQEIERVIPVIGRLSKEKETLISIDTRKAKVAKAALDAGANMVNDISGLKHDEKMARLIAKYKVPVCVMHMRGTPADMQKKTGYADLMGEIVNELEESIAIARNAGILHGKIILDPGIGFGKTTENNLDILKRLRELKVLGCPILIGPSRKSVIGKVLNLPEDERVEGTAAAAAIAIANGADFIRVHDVREMARVARMTDAIVRRKQVW